MLLIIMIVIFILVVKYNKIEIMYDLQAGTSSGAAYVAAINKAFGMNLGVNTANEACARKHSSTATTVANAHAQFQAGDYCGSRGEIWVGTSDPTMAASLWLNSPPHAAIVRGASALACASANSGSTTCLAY